MEAFNQNSVLSLLINELSNDEVVLTPEIKGQTAFQWARTLEGLTNEQRLRVWPLLDVELSNQILAEMREDARHILVSQLPQEELVNVVSMGVNAATVEIIDALPKKTASKLINKLSPELQSHLETCASFKENQVGRYANPNVYTINVNANVTEVLEEIRAAEEPYDLAQFIVVSENFEVMGEVSINELLNANESSLIIDLFHRIEPILSGETGLLEASNTVRSSNKNVLPVVSNEGQLIGVFSIKDALDVFQKSYEAQVAHMGQVNDEDLFAPTFISARRRAVWLGINLLTAFMASAVIGLFENVLIEVVALAVLMPIVASMGGITGSQTLTLAIRGLATGQLNQGNYRLLRNKEFFVSLLNGVLWAVIVASTVWYWFGNGLLSTILAIALIVNMLVAAISGLVIPITLEKIGVDPALAGSVILTTVTDVVGFFVFLGGATLLFLT